jgi:HupE / UreJ protein
VRAIVTRLDRRGLSTHWPARAAALLLSLVAACTAVGFLPATAEAHPLSTSAVLLDVGSDEVTGQVQLPIDRLAIAVNQPLTATLVAAPAKLEELRRYVADHVSAAGSTDSAPWAVDVIGGRVETIDGVDHLVYDLALRSPDRTVRDFRLHYDAIVERLLSHRILVSSRATGSDTYTAVGFIDWESQTLTVPTHGVAPEQGFLAAMRLGVEHIAEGADHLLFLVMLLLPAPLLARRGRWVHTDGLRRHCFRIVHVVTAFAVGHSITLALAALGYVSVPTRLVESVVALSILVSGVHAIRPVVCGGEVLIAAGFGLMHGLAFAALLGGLDLGRGSLVAALLGFNLGIELAQLLVVALIMPSLIVLSRTQLYPVVKTASAGSGIVLATAWLAERTTLITVNPLDGVATALVAHPFVVAVTLACLTAVAWSVPALRNPSPAVWMLKAKGG